MTKRKTVLIKQLTVPRGSSRLFLKCAANFLAINQAVPTNTRNQCPPPSYFNENLKVIILLF